MNKRTVVILMVIILLSNIFPIANAHPNERNHNDDLERVLLGHNKATVLNKENKTTFQYLEYATSLAIDQVNGYKGTYLEALKRYGIPNLPDSITDTIDRGGFDFTANNHRQYTHLGWSYEYSEEYRKANWPLRRQIMVETAKKVLNIKEAEISDAFAALLYYIHILGDLQDDSKQTERDQVIPLIDKHGLFDAFVYRPNRDIFSELIHYLPIIFDNKVPKVYRSYYTSMMRDIKNMYSRVKKVMMNNSETVNEEYNNSLTPEQLDKSSKELLEILSKYLPTLLEQTLFQGIFY